MSISNIREQLQRDEGERLDAYRDTEGLLTIGIGRCIDRVPFTVAEAAACGCTPDNTDYSQLRITPEASKLLFEHDVARVQWQIARAFPWAALLDEARYGVLVNMAFNLGLGGLQRFTRFLAAMEAKDWQAASVHMMDSKWAHQVGPRALRLRDQVQSGRWV